MILTLLRLFWSFVKIGFTSFGGLSMIPLITHEVVSNGWMNLSEVSDIVAIAEMTPGPLGAELRHLCRNPCGRHSRCCYCKSGRTDAYFYRCSSGWYFL